MKLDSKQTIATLIETKDIDPDVIVKKFSNNQLYLYQVIIIIICTVKMCNKFLESWSRTFWLSINSYFNYWPTHSIKFCLIVPVKCAKLLLFKAAALPNVDLAVYENKINNEPANLLVQAFSPLTIYTLVLVFTYKKKLTYTEQLT